MQIVCIAFEIGGFIICNAQVHMRYSRDSWVHSSMVNNLNIKVQKKNKILFQIEGPSQLHKILTKEVTIKFEWILSVSKRKTSCSSIKIKTRNVFHEGSIKFIQ